MDDLIEGYLRHLRAAERSKHTVEDRRKLLRRLDHDLPRGLDQVAAEELEEWLAQFSHGDGPSWTVCTYFTAIRAFYGWAVKARQLVWNPTEDMAQPRCPDADPHPWAEAELALAMRLPRPYRTAVILAAFEGLRCEEIWRLAREDIDGWCLRVKRKGGRVQELPTDLQVVWPEVAELPPGPVVRHRRGPYSSPDQLSAAVSNQLNRIGLEDRTLHGARHRFATISLLPEDFGGAGVDIRTVQELLGHRRLSSTERYIAVTNRQLRNAIAKLPVPASPHQETA